VRRASCARRRRARRGSLTRWVAQDCQSADERDQRPARQRPASTERAAACSSRARCTPASRRTLDELGRQRQAGGPDTLAARVRARSVAYAVIGGALKPAVGAIVVDDRARVAGFVGAALQRILKERVAFIPHTS